MSDGIETTQAHLSEDAEPSALGESLAEAGAAPQQEVPQAAPEVAAQSAAELGLTPPPIPRLTKAQKANLLPPPPRVKSRYASRKDVAPLPAAAQATQSTIEQAPTENQAHPGEEAVSRSAAQEPQETLENLLASPEAQAGSPIEEALGDLDSQAQSEARALLEHTLSPQVNFPEDVSEHLPEQLSQQAQDLPDPSMTLGGAAPQPNPLEAPAPASHPNFDAIAPSATRPRPAFQSSLNTQAESKSSNATKIIFAVVGLLILAGLCWWKLGGA